MQNYVYRDSLFLKHDPALVRNDNMIKKIAAFVAFIAMLMACIAPTGVYADDNSKKKIENIISGKQDYLVFASLGSKDASFFDVQVMNVVGADAEMSDEDKDALERRFKESISVSGIDSYMYFDGGDDKPRTGDNILLSIDHMGANDYVVKNGVFRVDSVSYDQFKFEVPEALSGTDEMYELGALYTYVYTNGEIKTISIRNDGVYYKDTEDKDYTKQSEGIGVSFLDEFGDPTGGGEAKYPELQHPAHDDKRADSKWELVLVILVLGLVSGAVFVKILKKFDKRYDTK